MQDSKNGWQEQKDVFNEYFDMWLDAWIAYLMALRIHRPSLNLIK